MNQEAREQLNSLLKMAPNTLNAHQLGFIRARASYLTEEQQIVYGLKEAPKPEAQPEVEAPKAPKKKK